MNSDGIDENRGSLAHFGSARLGNNGQVQVPVELRRNLGLDDRPTTVQVFADLGAREIILIQEPSDASALADALRSANRS